MRTHTHPHQGAEKQQTRPDQKCLREASRHNDRVRADTSPQGRLRLHEVHLEFDDARLTLLRPSHHPQHDRLLPEARRPNPHQTAPEHREHSANCHLLPQWHFYGAEPSVHNCSFQNQKQLTHTDRRHF